MFTVNVPIRTTQLFSARIQDTTNCAEIFKPIKNVQMYLLLTELSSIHEPSIEKNSPSTVGCSVNIAA